MKLSTRAALFSAFLFPGSGQVYLKCYLRGAIFGVVAVVGLYFIMSATFTIALTIADDIQSGKVSTSITGLQLLVEQAMDVYNEPELKAAKIAILISWIMSTVDAYISGKNRIADNDEC